MRPARRWPAHESDEGSPDATREVHGDGVQRVVNADMLEQLRGGNHDDAGYPADDDCAVVLHHGTG